MRQRHRVSTDLEPRVSYWAVKCEPFGEHHHDLKTPTFHWKKFNSMVDVVGNPKGFNPCEHIRVKGRPAAYGQSGIRLTTPSGKENWVEVPPEDVIAAVPLPPDELIEEELQKFMTRWTEQMPAVADLGVFLGELRNGIKEVLPLLRDITSRMSGHWLKWNFGQKPFIQDIQKLLGVWEKFTDRMERLRKTQGKTYRENGRRRDFWEPELTHTDYVYVQHTGSDPDSQEFPAPPPCPGLYVDPLTVRVQLESYSVKLSGTGFISNQLENMDNIFDQVEAVGAALGLNNPLKILWNLTPWTWLTDWVVDVGALLEPLEVEPFDGKLVFQGGFHSIKVKAFVTIEHIDAYSGMPGSKGEYVVTRYIRREGMGQATSDRLLRLMRTKILHPPGETLDSAWRISILLSLLDQRFGRRIKKVDDLRIAIYKGVKRKLPYYRKPGGGYGWKKKPRNRKGQQRRRDYTT